MDLEAETKRELDILKRDFENVFNIELKELKKELDKSGLSVGSFLFFVDYILNFYYLIISG